MERFWDYDECLDIESFVGVEAYFHRRYEAYADYTLDEDVASERHKKDNRKEADKKPQQRDLLEQDQYDAVEEQAKRDMMNMERHMRRASMFGGYIPGGMERDF